jgi:hypothetical protein
MTGWVSQFGKKPGFHFRGFGSHGDAGIHPVALQVQRNARRKIILPHYFIIPDLHASGIFPVFPEMDFRVDGHNEYFMIQS